MGSEDDWKSVVTDVLATQNKDPEICETKTRVMSRPQKEWDSAQDRVGYAWKWQWLKQEKIQDERLMMGHLGKRSDDLVEVAKSSGERSLSSRGIQAVRELFNDKGGSNDGRN